MADINSLVEQLSELTPFVEFARADPLALSDLPARFYYEVRRARRLLPRAVDALEAPTLVACASADPVCDNDRNRALLGRARAPLRFLEYAGARHVLEFSQRRDAFLEDLAAWFEERERR